MGLRYAFLASAAIALLLPGFASAQPAAIVRSLLDDAAARFDIPRPLLYGIAYNESRWRDISPDSLPGSCSGMPAAHGIMGLRDDDHFGRSLHAATAIGITPQEAMTSIEKNITAGAWHLSTLFEGIDRSDLRDWIGAIARYPGIPDSQPAIRLLYVDGVLELLRGGWYIDDQYVPPVAVPGIDRARLRDELTSSGLTILGGSDYPGADWRPSPNFSSRGGAAISAITIHDTEGSFAGSLSWLTSTASQASAHYMIRSVDGLTVQMVSEADKAWHVRTENPYTIGIEHEGYVARPEYFTQEMYTASASLVRYLIDKYDVPLERTHIKGHIDFPNNTHTDPGGWWDWPGYYRMIDPSRGARVVIDPFEDNVIGWWSSGMSGSTVKVDTAATTLAITPGMAHRGANGARISYSFTDASGGVARFFRSGHGNTRDGLLNVGSSGYVTLDVHGDGSDNELELWFYDNAKGNVIVKAGAIGWRGWRAIAVPVGSLGSAGPYRFHSIVLRQSAGGKRAGAIGVDELAHQTMPLGVDDDIAGELEDRVSRKIAVASSDPLPLPLRDMGSARIISSTGSEIVRFDRLPDLPAGEYLKSGVYAVVVRDASYLLLVTP